MKVLHWICNLALIAFLVALPGASFSQVSVSITVAPPELPVYEQPICPAANYIWTPGYWAWGPGGYYWVPGTWVLAPAVGLLWTPGYWGWGDGAYLWHAGYWGPTVGFYGGVDYGFGYGGSGFYGGRWVGGYFSYNTAVMRVNTTIIRNTYVDRTVIVHNRSRVSFNGGRGGIQARPTSMQLQAQRQRRFGPVAAQTNQARFARDNKANWASQNHGIPRYAALQRPATSAADFNRAAPAQGYRPVSKTSPVSNARSATSSATRKEARPTTRSETRAATRKEATPTARTETKPAARKEARTATRTESRPATRKEATPKTRTETRAATRTEPRTATRTETRPATRAQARPPVRTETRHATRPTTEARPVTRSRPTPASRPAPAAHPAKQTRAEARPQAKPEARPAPQRKPEEEKPR